MTNPPIPLASSDTSEVNEMPWGRLVWMIASRLGNSETMTFGRCYIDPGEENHRHLHPNCDEVIHLLHGSIEHSFDEQTIAMRAGDTLSIPAGVVHNARNVGDDEAAFVIVFSSADRQTISEEERGR